MVHGNAEVVSLFEIWLDRARAGKICHATVTACEQDNLACDFAGVADMEFSVPYALDILKLKLGERARASSSPPVENTSADYVSYNLASSPASFDFLSWLVDAEMTRAREGAPAPLKVSFVNESGLNTEYRMGMFLNVMRPMLKLIGAVEGETVGRSKKLFVLRDVSEACRRGDKVPKLKASDKAMDVVSKLVGGYEPITITLRETGVWTYRNSNFEAWTKFAKELMDCGEKVIFVRDTSKAGEPLPGFTTFPLASVNLDVRMALYESSKRNFFVTNGPFSLALFGTKPWVVFNKISEDDPFNSRSFWHEVHGITDQFPWARSDQKMIWGEDSHEKLHPFVNE